MVESCSFWRFNEERDPPIFDDPPLHYWIAVSRFIKDFELILSSIIDKTRELFTFFPSLKNFEKILKLQNRRVTAII